MWKWVAQWCLTLCDPMESTFLLGSSVHGILQARILEWVAILFCKGSCQPRDWTRVFCIAVRFFTSWPPRGFMIINLLISVQLSHSVMSDSLQTHGLKPARLSCPSPAPKACTNSCALSRWCRSTISSSVAPFSSCPQSLPASGLFQTSQFFASGGQSIGASTSASASVLSVNIQDWFPLG